MKQETKFKDTEIGMIPDMPKSLLRFLREKRFKKDSHRDHRAHRAAGKYSVQKIYVIYNHKKQKRAGTAIYIEYNYL